MFKTTHAIVAAVLMLLTISALAHAENKLNSGLQPGEELSALFEPLNVTGPFAGEQHCLVCENGANPVAMIFARELSQPLVKLIARIDAATGKHKGQDMGSFVVFLSDKEELKSQLEETAKEHKLEHIILSTFDPAGPEGFKVANSAAVTVVLYESHKVQANHAFAKGQLTDKSIEAILADVPKILPAEKSK
jgi:hypothetical protein